VAEPEFSPNPTRHPARFPPAIPEFFVKLCTRPGEVVLDPFAGTGTTAVVAEGLERRWLMAELDAIYCDVLPERLEDLRAAGRVTQLRGPSQARWYQRLFYEAGVLPAPLRPLELPPGLSGEARRLAHGFALLLALRELADGGPTPYTRSFAGPWCGMGERQAGEGITELLRAGVLVKAAQQGAMNLYLPVRGAQSRGEAA
jgi:hypothetical protein